jgi:RluA family pseudouridine synthase
MSRDVRFAPEAPASPTADDGGAAAEIPILYEDDVLLAVNKPPRLPAHSGAETGGNSLQGLLQERLGRALVLFHRLDIDTTGVVLLGKKRSVNAAMAAMFEGKRIRKTYWTVVAGRWLPQWNRIETRIARDKEGGVRNVVAGGRLAVSTCRLLASNGEKSWVEFLPKTGRRHQVRLHCVAMGCPILGDRIYGEGAQVPMALHARRIDMRHPINGLPLRIEAPLPKYWFEIWLDGLDVERYRGTLLPDRC